VTIRENRYVFIEVRNDVKVGVDVTIVVINVYKRFLFFYKNAFLTFFIF